MKICIVSSISDRFDEFMNYEKKMPARYILFDTLSQIVGIIRNLIYLQLLIV